MRRLALLLATLMLAITTGSAAQAINDPYAEIPDFVSLGCTIVTPASATTQGELSCTGSGLQPGTTFRITANWRAIQAFGAFHGDAAAVAFVGAQSGLTTVITGTVDANGEARGAGVIPAGADTSQPAIITLEGTAKDGSAALETTTVNEPAAQPDTGAGAEETPATGAESGILALISLALVAAGAGAVLMTRRRNQETVA